jgi:hypothetical protein
MGGHWRREDYDVTPGGAVLNADISEVALSVPTSRLPVNWASLGCLALLTGPSDFTL